MSDDQTRRRNSKRNGEAGDKPATLREPVTLMKGAHRWSFCCEAGEEPALLRRLSELASDPKVPFDWFDAALVSHQLSKRLRPGLQRIDTAAAANSQGPGN